MVTPPENPADGIGYRNILALVVLCFSLLAVTVLACVIIWNKSDESRNVMSAVLPLIGSWVGTILAYYFSKENFEAATRSVTELARSVSPQEVLQSTQAKDKMISRQMMHVEVIADATTSAQVKLMDVLTRLDAAKKGNRVPFLDNKDYPLYVIHRSVIDKYLADAAIQGKDAKTLTLKDFLDDPNLSSKMATSFTTVRRDATLADAKKALDDVRARGNYCQDVFVTDNGTRDEAVLGWITNIIIEENSRV